MDKTKAKSELHIIKIGGNVIDNSENLYKFLKDFTALEGYKILVHGGGKVATQLSETLGIETKLVDGRRITDIETLRVVTMVYGGLINKNIVAQLQRFGTNAIGLTGADGDFIRTKKRPVKAIDYGFVGDIEEKSISPENIKRLMGVLKDINDEASLIKELDPQRYLALKEQQIIHSGMLPKLDNAFTAIGCGVKAVIIGHADKLGELKKNKSFGTRLSKSA
jgi:acetylglutamate kinase